jgi:hypothetical protein
LASNFETFFDEIDADAAKSPPPEAPEPPVAVESEKPKPMHHRLSRLPRRSKRIPADDLDGLVNTVRKMRAQPTLAGPDAQELEALRVFSNASHLQDSISYIRGFKEPIASPKLQWIDRAANGKSDFKTL